AFVGGIVSFLAGLWTGHMQRRASTDQKIHDERQKQYQLLLALTRPFALYFPPAPEPGDNGRRLSKAGSKPLANSITPTQCAISGNLLSDWYFAGGGLVMSAATRDAYFVLAGALTGAASAGELNVPSHPAQSRLVAGSRVDALRKSLLVLVAAGRPSGLGGSGKKLAHLPDGPAKFWTGDQVSKALAASDLIDNWSFGLSRENSGNPETDAALGFSDFLIIQNAGSRLRTAMAEDLHSRRRPE
ncbi:MAG: hypothetical protein WCC66_02275, partial [Rhizobiaceae bacterium]